MVIHLADKYIKKNKLDLEYKFEAQKANIWLSLGTIAVIGFITSMIVQNQNIIAFSGGSLIAVIAYLNYRKSKLNISKILMELENL